MPAIIEVDSEEHQFEVFNTEFEEVPHNEDGILVFKPRQKKSIILTKIEDGKYYAYENGTLHLQQTHDEILMPKGNFDTHSTRGSFTATSKAIEQTKSVSIKNDVDDYVDIANEAKSHTSGDGTYELIADDLGIVNSELEIYDIEAAADEQFNDVEKLDVQRVVKLKPKQNDEGACHQCKHCAFKTSEAYLLSHHMKIHSTMGQFKCAECCKEFKQFSHLKSHLNIHLDRKLLPCRSCDIIEVDSEENQLENHLEVFNTEFEEVPHNEDGILVFRPRQKKSIILTKIGDGKYYAYENGIVHDQQTDDGSLMPKGNFNTHSTHDSTKATSKATKQGKSVSINNDVDDYVDIANEAKSHTSGDGTYELIADDLGIVNSELEIYDIEAAADEQFNDVEKLDVQRVVKLKPKQNDGGVCHQCKHCAFKTSEAYLLSHHMKIHSTMGQFKCAECCKEFKQFSHLKSHLNIHLDRKLLPCRSCGIIEVDSEENQLENHLEVFNTEFEEVPHNEDGILVFRPRQKKSIILTKIGDGKYYAYENGIVLVQQTDDGSLMPKGNFDTHSNTHSTHDSTKATSKATKQGKSVSINNDVDDYVDIANEAKSHTSGDGTYELIADDLGIVNSELEIYDIEAAADEQFNDVEKLDVQRVVKLKPKQNDGGVCHQCTHCAFKTSDAYLLSHHMKTHATMSQFKCAECGKGFKKLAYLKSHLNVHLDIKPFPCSSCERRFTTLSALRQHRSYKHTNEKPHQCNMCPYASTNLHHLIYHKRIHFNEKPYKCTICNKSFRWKYVLTRHNNFYHTEGYQPQPKIHKCPYCRCSFARKGNVLRHMNIPDKKLTLKCTDTAVAIKLEEADNSGEEQQDADFLENIEGSLQEDDSLGQYGISEIDGDCIIKLEEADNSGEKQQDADLFEDIKDNLQEDDTLGQYGISEIDGDCIIKLEEADNSGEKQQDADLFEDIEGSLQEDDSLGQYGISEIDGDCIIKLEEADNSGEKQQDADLFEDIKDNLQEYDTLDHYGISEIDGDCIIKLEEADNSGEKQQDADLFEDIKDNLQEDDTLDHYGILEIDGDFMMRSNNEDVHNMEIMDCS